ncbi:hypothetical protein L1887_57370 [Cichorium endivia]|nr:hypothetical protein L1887_57370 [Cichorium endivia]
MLHCLFARAEEEFTRCASCGNRAAKAHRTAPRRGEATHRPIGAASRFSCQDVAAVFEPAVQLQASCDALAGTLTAQQFPTTASLVIIVCWSRLHPLYPRRTASEGQGHGHGPRLPVPEGGLCQRACKSRPRWSEGFRRLAPQTHLLQRATPGPNCAPLSSTSSAEERASKPVLPLSCPDDHKPQQQNTEQRRARGNAPVVPTCRGSESGCVKLAHRPSHIPVPPVAGQSERGHSRSTPISAKNAAGWWQENQDFQNEKQPDEKRRR